jgi:hypothetical protein
MDVNKPEIFVSFAPEDERFGSRLVNKLKQHFPNASIHRALRELSVFPPTRPNKTFIFIPVLSPAYLRSDERRNLSSAMLSALEGKLRLIPVMAQPCKPPGFVGVLQTINFGDEFGYDEAFAILVRGIAGEHTDGAEPGAVRCGVAQRELGNIVFSLVAKQILPMPLVVAAPFGSSSGGRRSIFLSYPSHDKDFVGRLIARLNKLTGVHLRDRRLEPVSRSFSDVVARDFGNHDIFLPVLSPEYLSDPELREELTQATRLVLCGQGRLVPVMCRVCTPSGFLGMLKCADFTNEAKLAHSMDALLASIEGHGDAERSEPGDVRIGITLGEIGRTAEAINQVKKGIIVQEQLEFEGLTDKEAAALEQDVETEISATLKEVRAGEYDDELLKAGIAEAKASLPVDSPWSINKGSQEMSGAEVAVLTLLAREGIKIGDRVLTDLWKTIIFPRIQARYGAKLRTKK